MTRAVRINIDRIFVDLLGFYRDVLIVNWNQKPLL